MAYKATLLELLKHANPEYLKKGYTIIFIWEDKKHYQEVWNPFYLNTNDIRILTIPTSELSEIETVNDKNNILVCGVGFSTKKDYSDLELVYYMEVGI